MTLALFRRLILRVAQSRRRNSCEQKQKSPAIAGPFNQDNGASRVNRARLRGAFLIHDGTTLPSIGLNMATSLKEHPVVFAAGAVAATLAAVVTFYSAVVIPTQTAGLQNKIDT
jgi:hypothetical protein